MTPPYYYKQSTATGTQTKYTTCLSFYGYNGTDTKSITYNESVVATLPDGSQMVQDGTGQVTATMANPNEVFNLRNPDTGAVTGTMTYQALYLALYSMYLHAAEKRDAAPNPPAL